MTNIQCTIKKIFLLFIITLFLPLLLLQVQNARAAVDGSYQISVPNAGNLISGCVYAADIRVNSGSNQSNAADVIVLYNPSLIEIIDSQPLIAGKQISPGAAYEVYPSTGNVVDEVNGVIRLAGISLGSNFSGNAVFGSIQFRSKPGAVNASFVVKFDGAGATLDSNIAETNSSTDILASKTDANMTFSAGACVTDTTPPNISFISPINNQSNVPLNQNITLSLSDSASGVNISTLEILVNGIPYTSSSSEITVSGNPGNYSLIINPNAPFFSNFPSNIFVRVTDFAGNTRQSSIAFNYPVAPSVSPTPSIEPDLISPSITFINPIANENIGSNETITFSISDSGSGVNLNNLIIYINDKRYLATDLSVTISGNQSNYQIAVADNFKFSNVSSSYISVFVTDNSSNATASNIIFNIPQNVVDEDKQQQSCPVNPNASTSKICPVTDIPLSSQVNDLQKTLESSVPEVFKPVVSEGGFLGLASLVALLPLLIQGLISLASLLLGGFLWPFISAIILPSKQKAAKVVDDFSKEGLMFVKITVFEKLTGSEIRKAYSDFTGNFAVHLDPGQYVFKFEKSGYKITEAEISLTESKDIDYTFEIAELEEADLASKMQFKVFNLDPKLLSLYFALLFSVVNLLYLRSLFAVILFIVALVLVFVLTIKTFMRKKTIKRGEI